MGSKVDERKISKLTKRVLKELYALKKVLEEMEEYYKMTFNSQDSNHAPDLKFVYKWIGLLENSNSVETLNEVWAEVQNIGKFDGLWRPENLGMKKDKLIQRLWKATLNAVAEARKHDK